MLGTTPLVSMSDRRLGGMANSSLLCLAAIASLAFSTSRIVKPSCSRKTRKLCPPDCIYPPRSPPAKNQKFHRALRPMFQFCNKKLLFLSCKNKVDGDPNACLAPPSDPLRERR